MQNHHTLTGESLAVEAKQRFESGMVKLVEGVQLGEMHVVRGKVRFLLFFFYKNCNVKLFKFLI